MPRTVSEYRQAHFPALRLIVNEPERPPIRFRPLPNALLEVLERKWALHVLFLIDEAPKRFGELQTDLCLNPSSLRNRLVELEYAGIVEHFDATKQRPYPHYALTLKGHRIAAGLWHMIGAVSAVAIPERERQPAARRGRITSDPKGRRGPNSAKLGGPEFGLPPAQARQV